ncbi:hypothetical protein IYZ83_002100 [Wolbachia pipientis]|uniref:hypothetical protein n=1 Tax=Wolbachia pipientis TaxID=955 RepID=UPI001F258E16|nr:hypothetical protein [Wolbachia pipientis]UIP92006.1 hypothetical protein IYZ83_002100 [Wolbachia pipientis]
MTRIICVASVVYFKIRFFFEIYYHENSNFPFAAGLMMGIQSLESCRANRAFLSKLKVKLKKLLFLRTYCTT